MQQTKTITLQEFPLPKTVELERQVLADIVAAPEAIGDAMRFIDAECFTNDGRKGLWNTIVGMFNRGEVVDMTTMFDRGGDTFINECVAAGNLGGTQRTAIQHAALLRDAATRRRGYFAAIEMLKATTEPSRTGEDICALSESLSRQVQGQNTMAKEVPLDTILDRIGEQLEERHRLAKEGKLYRVPTGFEALDFQTYQGWGPGQLIVLAARPSVGKTALMMKFAKAAATNGFPVGIYSLEMTDEELGDRLLYSTGNVQPTDINLARIYGQAYKDAAAPLRGLPIYVNDESRSIEEIISRISINVRAGNCKIAFIDYLGLMNVTTSYRENMNQAIAKMTGELKATAKRLRIPIVMLCQLNRDSVRADRAPELQDLRDSGAIEQDADIVMMLENDTTIEPSTGLRDILIWVRKNRQYKRDICVRVRPNKSYSDFAEIDILMPDGAQPQPEPEVVKAKPESINDTITKESLTDDDEEDTTYKLPF